MRRAEIANAIRQEGRFRVATPVGDGWVHGPLDDSGSMRVALDDGATARVALADIARPRRPPATAARAEPRPLALPISAPSAAPGPLALHVNRGPARPRPAAPTAPAAPTHWHVWVAGDPGPRRPVGFLRRLARPFTSRQSAHAYARRREPDGERVIVRGCRDAWCRWNRTNGDR